MKLAAPPPAQGLYDPRHEHDACGVGFVVDLKGRKSPSIVKNALEVLLNLQHRGACGCEKNTGDGAGILLQMPHRFLAAACDRAGIDLPAERGYGAGCVFLPTEPAQRAPIEALFESARVDMKQGDFAAARSKLIESLQLEETVGTLFNLGLCEEKLGHPDGALAAWARVPPGTPVSAWSVVARAVTLTEQRGRFSEGEALLEGVLRDGSLLHRQSWSSPRGDRGRRLTH